VGGDGKRAKTPDTPTIKAQVKNARDLCRSSATKNRLTIGAVTFPPHPITVNSYHLPVTSRLAQLFPFVC